MIYNAGEKLFAVKVRAFGEADVVIFDRSSYHRTQFHRSDSLSDTVVVAYRIFSQPFYLTLGRMRI